MTNGGIYGTPSEQPVSRASPAILAAKALLTVIAAIWLAWGNFGWVDHIVGIGERPVDARVLATRSTRSRSSGRNGSTRTTGYMTVAYELDGRSYTREVLYEGSWSGAALIRLGELQTEGTVRLYVDPSDPSDIDYRPGPRDNENFVWLFQAALVILALGMMLAPASPSSASTPAKSHGSLRQAIMNGAMLVFFAFVLLAGLLALTLLVSDTALGLRVTPWARVGCAGIAAALMALTVSGRARATG